MLRVKALRVNFWFNFCCFSMFLTLTHAWLLILVILKWLKKIMEAKCSCLQIIFVVLGNFLSLVGNLFFSLNLNIFFNFLHKVRPRKVISDGAFFPVKFWFFGATAPLYHYPHPMRWHGLSVPAMIATSWDLSNIVG